MKVLFKNTHKCLTFQKLFSCLLVEEHCSFFKKLCQFFTEQVPMMNVSYKPQKISPKSKVSWTFNQFGFFWKKQCVCLTPCLLFLLIRTLCACSFTRRFVTLTYTLSLSLTSSNRCRLNKSWIRRWAGFVHYEKGVWTGSVSLMIMALFNGKDDLMLLLVNWAN